MKLKNQKTAIAIATALAAVAGTSQAAFTTMIGNSDWATGTWDNGDPNAAGDAVIGTNIVGTANVDITGWSGSLTMNSNSQLRMTSKSLGYGTITGATSISMATGSLIYTNSNGTLNAPSILLTGNATWESVDDWSTLNFANISGPHTMTFISRNGKKMRLTTSNSFSEFISIPVDRTCCLIEADTEKNLVLPRIA
ncbi:MAG: hypothetical protein QMC23_06850, partial [Rubritalea sp.]